MKNKNKNKKYYIIFGIILTLIISFIIMLKVAHYRIEKAILQQIELNNKEFNQASNTDKEIVEQPIKVEIDENKCSLIQIGGQTWTAENLNVSHFRNGDEIPEVKDDTSWEKAGINHQPAWCYYNNGEKTTYGKLYNFWAVIDSRGLAPVGFHIASRDEWEILLDFLGHDRYDMWSTKAGEKLISEKGFNALFGGMRYDFGSFNDINENNGLWERGWWWTYYIESSGSLIKQMVGLKHELTIDGPNSCSYKEGTGLSVRCIKGDLDTASVRKQAESELNADFNAVKKKSEQEELTKNKELKNAPKKTYSTDGQKCIWCGLGFYQSGFCNMCQAASKERTNESYSKAANCEACRGSGFVKLYDGNKVCPSCNGKGKQIY